MSRFQLANCSDSVLILKAVELEASGTYRCEVSTEAPYFRTEIDEKTVTVVRKSAPQLSIRLGSIRSIVQFLWLV